MRKVISAFSLLAVAVIVYLAKDELVRAWFLLFEINAWWLLLLIPLQLIVYFAMSETGMSYLEEKRQVEKVSVLEKTKIALELNFVNHVLPSGGMSGVAYGLWRYKTVGVSNSNATLAQFVRLFAAYFAYIPVLVLCVIISLLLDTKNAELEAYATLAVFAALCVMVGAVYILSKKSMLVTLSTSAVRLINYFLRKVTFGKVRTAINEEIFLENSSLFVQEVRVLFSEKRLLLKPVFWGLVWIFGDALMFEISFLALGHPEDITAIFLAYGFAGLAGFLIMTPGGTGAYETAFVMVLVAAGASASYSTTAILLTRVILMASTLLTGAYFYHRALASK